MRVQIVIYEEIMTNNRMTEGVGKKIVEALKMQSDIEINPINSSEDLSLNDEHETEIQQDVQQNNEDILIEDDDIFDNQPISIEENQNLIETSDSFIQQEQVAPQINIQKQFITTDNDDFEIPSNVAVLKQLVTKLPAGVTKQTGAVIIRQTMEALGISMKSVLQEAQQVQEGLNNSSRECQASIMEYKKQIGILEKQAQKYQRQYAALNDIISLFIQTNI